jgi:hypothetical protein
MVKVKKVFLGGFSKKGNGKSQKREMVKVKKVFLGNHLDNYSITI